MTILALEADPAQTTVIRHVVRDIVQADVTVVDSIERALQTLHAETPDVVLVPALLSPTDEADLLSAIRQLPDAGHVEVLTTPRFSRSEPQTAQQPRAWLRWGWHQPSANGVPPSRGAEDETRLFAERLRWTLQIARERRQPEEDYLSAPEDVMSSAEALVDRPPVVPSAAPVSSTPAADARSARVLEDDERRQQRRVFGPFEGCWRGLVDTPVSIRDISEGGCFVNAFCEIEVDQKLTLTVEVPGGDTIEVNGLVVHALPGFGFAVRFVDLADRVRMLF